MHVKSKYINGGARIKLLKKKLNDCEVNSYDNFASTLRQNYLERVISNLFYEREVYLLNVTKPNPSSPVATVRFG